MKPAQKFVLFSAVIGAPMALLAYNPTGIFNAMSSNIYGYCGYGNPSCSNPEWAANYADWDNTRQSDTAELQTLMGNGGCTSQPAYCTALQQGIDEISELLGYIQMEIS